MDLLCVRLTENECNVVRYQIYIYINKHKQRILTSENDMNVYIHAYWSQKVIK